MSGLENIGLEIFKVLALGPGGYIADKISESEQGECKITSIPEPVKTNTFQVRTSEGELKTLEKKIWEGDGVGGDRPKDLPKSAGKVRILNITGGIENSEVNSSRDVSLYEFVNDEKFKNFGNRKERLELWTKANNANGIMMVDTEEINKDDDIYKGNELGGMSKRDLRDLHHVIESGADIRNLHLDTLDIDKDGHLKKHPREQEDGVNHPKDDANY